ncbi:catalase [Streptomyces sp. NPDC006997]|uniref:catalase n=1 Tax=Streptomyces sp. NPDC006997 TaxID=3155356 RepID=UPI0033C4A694
MTDVSSQGPAPGDEREVLTNRQGHPVYDNQNQRTVGARGPATLENYQFLEKISHFDRERIPERVVHARGVTAYGYFEAYGAWGEEPIGRYTRARLFQERGKRTDVAVRFSTVIGGRDSSEAARDPRGFAVKFYTEDGNWDLVGNNLGVFFIRDAIKFPDVIHALKPDPVTFEQQPRRIFDFMSQTPESLHMLVNLFSPRGIPADYRHYEPSVLGGLREARYPTHDEQGPEIRGRVTRKRIPRANDYQQAGQRYLLMEQWERDDLVHNFVTLLAQCDRPVRERMVWHFLLVENDLGLRVGEGLGIGPEDVAGLEPLPGQDLTDEDRERLAHLGKNPPRDVSGLTMTHCVPDKRHVVTR